MRGSSLLLTFALVCAAGATVPACGGGGSSSKPSDPAAGGDDAVGGEGAINAGGDTGGSTGTNGGKGSSDGGDGPITIVPGVPGASTAMLVGGGTRCSSKHFQGVFTLGPSPGVTQVSTSESYGLTGAVTGNSN